MSHHVVQSYEVIKENGKQIIDLSPIPLYLEGRDGEKICVKDYYADVIPLIENGEDVSDNQKAQEYYDLVKKFNEKRLKGRVEIFDDTIEVTASPRTESIRLKEKEKFRLEREFVWIDGAENTEGRIILPYDDYNIVYVAKGSIDNPEIIEISEGQEGDIKPYYTKKNGETIIHMDGFSGGGGTQSDPYLVSTPTDLDNVRNNLSAYYEQTADIDMGSWGSFTPIPTFTGEYDGGGYKINNLTINSSEDDFRHSLFNIADGAIFKNINLKNASIEAIRQGGILCGLVTGSTTEFINCTTSGYISVNNDLDPSSTGRPAIGGLVSNATANADIRKCFSDITVENISTNAGNNGELGGLLGDGSNISLNIQDSHTRLNLIDVNDVFVSGGITTNLAGRESVININNVYSLIEGNVRYGIASNYHYSGNVTVLNSYWYKEEDPEFTNNYGERKTINELKTQSTFVNWDFVNTWTMDSSDGYPALIGQPSGGGGSDTTPPGELTINSSSYTENSDGTYVVDFQYSLPSDEDLDLIRVYKDGTQITEYSAAGTSSYQDTVNSEGTYTYKFTTIDTSSNESNGVEVTMNISEKYPADGAMRLIANGKVLLVEVVYLQNADGMPHPFARIIANNNVCIFKLKRIDEVDNPNNYPLRIIAKQDIYLFNLSEST